MSERQPRDAPYWAKPVSELKVPHLPEEAINLNVEGRRLTGPLQGFGPMWQKTYRIRLSGADVSPAKVIEEWKANFPKFWPQGNRFYAPLTGIKPGDVAVLNLAAPGGMVLSTGIMVIYADEESFTFMTPEGHMMAAWITFSAYEEEGTTVAQAQVLMRSSDPAVEVVFRLGGHGVEDRFWHHTLQALAIRFGVDPTVQQHVTCVDPKIQWSEAKNIFKNTGLRTTLGLPGVWLRRVFGRPRN